MRVAAAGKRLASTQKPVAGGGFGHLFTHALNNIRSAISDDEGASGPEVAASRAGGKFCGESTNEWATMIVNN